MISFTLFRKADNRSGKTILDILDSEQNNYENSLLTPDNMTKILGNLVK